MEFYADLWKADRVEAGFTQAEEAELLGCTNQHISEIETGKRNPSKRILAAKADLYGRKGRYYYGIDDQRIFDKATERLEQILNMPIDGDEASIREMLYAVRVTKAVEMKTKETHIDRQPSEAQIETEKNVNEDLMPEGADPLAEDNESSE